MEEVKFKLEHSDSAIVSSACERLFASIFEDFRKETPKNEGLELLWQKVKTSSKPLTASSCAKVITQITLQTNFLDPKDVLSSFLAAASHATCMEGICWSIGQILWSLKTLPTYGIVKNQHPFVALLRSSPQKTWPLIATQVQLQLEEDLEKAIALHRPVFIFVFCDPHGHSYFSAMRSVLLQSDLSKELLDHMVQWLPLEKCADGAFQENVSLIILPWMRNNSKESLRLMSSLLLRFVKRDLDPRQILALMSKDESPLDEISIILLAQVIEKTTFDVIEKTLELVHSKITKSSELHPLAFAMFVSSLFPVLLNSKQLSPRILEYGSMIIHQFYKSRTLNLEMELSSELEFDFQIAQVNNFVKLAHLPHDQFRMIGAKLLLKDDNLCDLLDNLVKVFQKDKTLTSKALTLLLHKLSMLEKKKLRNEKDVLKIIFTLPKLAQDRLCVPSILAFISRLEQNKGLAHFRLELLYQLWKTEPRTFSFLQRALEEDFIPSNERMKQSYFVTKANVIVKICQSHASLHGPDLLKPLNNLLNSSENVSVIKMALKGITILCQESVIDIITTIKVLAPKFKSDSRYFVIEQFYKLLSLLPTFQLDNEDYKMFVKSILSMIWKNWMNNELENASRVKIIEALACFPLEFHDCQMLDPFMPKNEEEAEFVPGQSWIVLLTQVQKNESKEVAEAIRAFILRLAQEELINFPRGIYHLSQAMRNKSEENSNYAFLPETSILKAIIGHFLQPSSELSIQPALLKILANLKDRPLPPLDWRIFKDNLVKIDRNDFVKLLTHQCYHSISAKIILEDFVRTWSSCEIALEIMPHFELVSKLACLKPFIQETLVLWHQSSEKDRNCRKIFLALIESYIQVLKSEDQDEPKEEILEAIFFINGEVSLQEEEYFKVILELPYNTLERLCECNQRGNLKKILIIRRKLAFEKQECSLQAMNEVIDFLANQDEPLDEEEEKVLKETLIEVFKVVPNQKLMKQWLLEMMGQILFILRQNCSVWTFNFMFEMFILSLLVMLDGQDEDIQLLDFKIFPLALSSFLQLEKYKDLGPQMAEWMMSLYIKDQVSKFHREILLKAFKAVKGCDGYSESSIWGRLTLF